MRKNRRGYLRYGWKAELESYVSRNSHSPALAVCRLAVSKQPGVRGALAGLISDPALESKLFLALFDDFIGFIEIRQRFIAFGWSAGLRPVAGHGASRAGEADGPGRGRKRPGKGFWGFWWLSGKFFGGEGGPDGPETVPRRSRDGPEMVPRGFPRWSRDGPEMVPRGVPRLAGLFGVWADAHDAQFWGFEGVWGDLGCRDLLAC